MGENDPGNKIKRFRRNCKQQARCGLEKTRFTTHVFNPNVIADVPKLWRIVELFSQTSLVPVLPPFPFCPTKDDRNLTPGRDRHHLLLVQERGPRGVQRPLARRDRPARRLRLLNAAVL